MNTCVRFCAGPHVELMKPGRLLLGLVLASALAASGCTRQVAPMTPGTGAGNDCAGTGCTPAGGAGTGDMTRNGGSDGGGAEAGGDSGVDE